MLLSTPPSRMLPMHRRRRPHGHRQGGFTLLEIVLAFSIMALGLAIAMQAATHAMRQSRQAAEQTDVALYAQNLLDSVGIDERIEEGETSGEFGDSGYRWRLTIMPYEIVDERADLPLTNVASSVELMELDLLVEWERGEQRREARFQTLRAMLPQVLQ